MAKKTKVAEIAEKQVAESKGAKAQNKRPARRFTPEQIVEFKKNQVEENRNSRVLVPETGEADMLIRMAPAVDRVLATNLRRDINSLPSRDVIDAKIEIREIIFLLSDTLSKWAEKLGKRYEEADYIKAQKQELDKQKAGAEAAEK